MPAETSSRWWSRRRRDKAPPGLDVDRPDLVVVASSFDAAEACSAVLARASATAPPWSPSEQAVLRHHLVLPQDQVDDAVAVAAQDGYRPACADPWADPSAGLVAPVETMQTVADGELLLLLRVQVLDALHCSQEQSRMAGLAQRRGGVALGWDALQPES